MQNTLKSYFEPASVAIVGATTDVAKAGYQITKNLVDRKFTGKVYPVNPKLDNLFGLACYPDLNSYPRARGAHGPVSLPPVRLRYSAKRLDGAMSRPR